MISVHISFVVQIHKSGFQNPIERSNLKVLKMRILIGPNPWFLHDFVEGGNPFPDDLVAKSVSKGVCIPTHEYASKSFPSRNISSFFSFFARKMCHAK